MRVWIVIFCVAFAAVLVGCGEDKNTKISLSKIEQNLENLDSLNPSEAAIAREILAFGESHNLITTHELNTILNAGEPLTIVATIPRGIYTLGLISGAKNFEFSNVFSGEWGKDCDLTQGQFMEFLGDKNGKIVFYDNNDGSAKVAYEWAKELGYNNLYYLAGSFLAWREHNFLITTEMPSCCAE